VTAGLDPRCQAARVWISAAIDAEASDAERAALRLHLSECHACRSWAALAESVSLQVRTSAPIEPVMLFSFPETEPARRPARRSPLRARARAAAFASPLLAAAAVAGVLLSGALQSAPPQTTQSHTPRQPVLTVAQVRSDGFVAGSSNQGGSDMRPRDTQQQQAAQVPVPRNRDLPEDAVP
jgi:predicted anti-sigma-YlaC factor YlaD